MIYYFYCYFSVKPALFDLFLAVGIASYLAIIYWVTEVNSTFIYKYAKCSIHSSV